MSCLQSRVMSHAERTILINNIKRQEDTSLISEYNNSKLYMVYILDSRIFSSDEYHYPNASSLTSVVEFIVLYAELQSETTILQG